MIKTQIPYQQTGYFSKLIVDYLDGKNELKPFYNHHCTIDDFKKVIEERKQLSIDRDVLASSLTAQYQGYEVHEKVKQQIQLLKKDNCFTVTTGHQLNLFTGPLYFIYKIISTINLTKQLKESYPEYDFVPIYWMATEDHDYEEVNHFNLWKKKYDLTKTQDGAVGKMKLTGVKELLSVLKEDLGDRNGANDIIQLLSTFYSEDKTFSQSIRGLINHLFGEYGLVIIDGDDASLKRLMIKEFQDELMNKQNHLTINATSEKLAQLGYKIQMNPREINLFYLREGSRERIVFSENKYQVLHSELTFSEEEIIEELNTYPERFSPNAPLRCMYQEKILPNIAYVGGGGELAYWFQLKGMFDANNISFPTLVLRNSVLIVDKGSTKRLQKLDIQSIKLFTDTAILIQDYLKKKSTVPLDLENEKQSLTTIFEDMAKKAGAIDPSLQPFVKAELQKSLKSLKNIESRLMKGEKQKEEVAVNQIKNIKEKLFPNHSLQERHDNIISLLISNGTSVIEQLMGES